MRDDADTAADHDRDDRLGHRHHTLSAVFVVSISRQTPKYVRYLGKVLPAAVFGLLVIYCLRNVSVLSAPYGIPELLSIALVVFLHLWKRQMLLSIAGGTIFYMILVQTLF